ncbi:MAG: hypothetical protein AB7P04_02370 [Bacteriovoracia bacterium]
MKKTYWTLGIALTAVTFAGQLYAFPMNPAALMVLQARAKQVLDQMLADTAAYSGRLATRYAGGDAKSPNPIPENCRTGESRRDFERGVAAATGLRIGDAQSACDRGGRQPLAECCVKAYGDTVAKILTELKSNAPAGSTQCVAAYNQGFTRTIDDARVDACHAEALNEKMRLEVARLGRTWISNLKVRFFELIGHAGHDSSPDSSYDAEHAHGPDHKDCVLEHAKPADLAQADQAVLGCDAWGTQAAQALIADIRAGGIADRRPAASDATALSNRRETKPADPATGESAPSQASGRAAAEVAI